MMQTVAGGMGRALGMWEAGSVAFYEQNDGATAIAVGMEVVADVAMERIRLAISGMMDRHPLLRARIIRHPGDMPRFELDVTPEQIDLTEHRIDHADQIDSWLEGQALQLLPIDSYLWRCAVGRIETERGPQTILLLVLHHAICDGRSVSLLLVEFLLRCAQDEVPGITDTGPLPLLPPVEHMLSEQTTWSEYLAHQQALRATEFDRVRFQKYAPRSQRATRTVTLELTEGETEHVISRSQSARLTVNSLVNAGMIIAARRIDPGQQRIAMSTPVDLRPYCAPDVEPHHLACYVSAATTIHTLDGDVVTIGRDYEDQLKPAIRRQALVPRDYDFEEALSFWDTVDADDRHEFSLGFASTNLGRIDLPKRLGGMELASYRGLISRVSGDWACMAQIATRQERMIIVLAYAEPLVSQEWVEEFGRIMVNEVIGNG